MFNVNQVQAALGVEVVGISREQLSVISDLDQAIFGREVAHSSLKKTGPDHQNPNAYNNIGFGD